MIHEERPSHHQERRRFARAQSDAGQVEGGGQRRKSALDSRDDTGGFLGVAMRHQPAWTFRNPKPHQEYEAGKPCTYQKGEPPAEIRVDDMRVKQDQRAERTDGSADPETSIDHQIGPATHARRNKFLNGGIDCRIFTANSRTGEKSKESEACDIP